MNSENSDAFMNDDQQPLKSGVKTGYVSHDGHISQIPGLSPTTKTLPKGKFQGRRFAVLDSDSDYVKLAKQGGHKGLLWHVETTPPTQKSPKEDSSPSNGEKSPVAFQSPKAPFWNDNMSTWERSKDTRDEKEKSDGDKCNQTEEMQNSTPSSTPNKFKRIVHDKKPAPVDMSKLLSFGYVDDNKPSQ